MKEFTYQIRDPLGIHARPAGQIIRIAKKYASTEILVQKEEKSANGSQLLRLMSLGIQNGDTVTVSAQGEQEVEAIEELNIFFCANL